MNRGSYQLAHVCIGTMSCVTHGYVMMGHGHDMHGYDIISCSATLNVIFGVDNCDCLAQN